MKIPFFNIYLHGRLQITTADYNYSREWLDRYARKLGHNHNACHVEVTLEAI